MSASPSACSVSIHSSKNLSWMGRCLQDGCYQQLLGFFLPGSNPLKMSKSAFPRVQNKEAGIDILRVLDHGSDTMAGNRRMLGEKGKLGFFYCSLGHQPHRDVRGKKNEALPGHYCQRKNVNSRSESQKSTTNLVRLKLSSHCTDVKRGLRNTQDHIIIGK